MDPSDDPKYEFDAPSHVDFKSLDQHGDDADLWFEKQEDGGASDGHLTSPFRNETPFGGPDRPNLPKAIVLPMASIKTDLESGSSQPSNIVTSWGDGAPSRTAAQPKRSQRVSAKPPAEPRRVLKRKEESGAAAPAPAAPPVKRLRSTPSRAARHSGGNALRRGQSGRLSSSKKRQPARAAPKAAASQSSPLPNSHEANELERIRNLQKEVAEHRKQNEASYKAALAGSHLPKKLTLATTVPKEFNFSTDTRVKVDTAATADKEVDFIAQLRRHPASPAKTRGATVPKPFNLSTTNKRKLEDSAAYVPMAQQIAQYHRRTPDRYHLRSRQRQERGPSPGKAKPLKITEPHTPRLMSRQRKRPTAAKSTAELEAEQAEIQRNYKFKALELNRDILERQMNPKKPAAKESTKVEGFALQIEKRLQERQAAKKPQEAEEMQTAFHSRPVPTKILEGVVGVPEKKAMHTTVPESPAFALKKRVRLDGKVEEAKPPSPFKALPVPQYGLPFQPQPPERNQVEMVPFSFDTRERDRQALKEKRLEEKRNEEVPKFKAQPLPDFEVILPEKRVIEPTKLEPFRLLIDQRGAIKAGRWEQTVKEEQKQQEEAAKFKARPNTVTHKEPFLPRKPIRSEMEATNSSTTVVEAFELSTERRARERQEYEHIVSEKEALRAQMAEEQRREEEQREKEDIARMRLEQVHKAGPVRHYSQVVVKPSDRSALTVPHSPNFSDRFRL